MSLSELFARSDARVAASLHSVRDARRVARRRLPSVVFDYIDGAADDEIAMRRNQAAFESVTFRPQMGSGCVAPALGVRVLGSDLSLPVVLAPCGLVRVLHPDGPAGAARAAASRGIMSTLSAVAGHPLEEVVAGSGVPMWFQLYASGGLPEAEALVKRAIAVDIEVLVVTVDTPTLGNREREVRHGVTPPLRVDSHNAVPLGLQVLARPRWAMQLASTGLRMSGRGAGRAANRGGMLPGVASPFSWGDVVALRDLWPGRLVVKGVLTADDARRAVDAGADAVVVSNHGGRQLDGAPATLRVLPDVAAAVGDQAEVLLDGGVRRGSHVVAALALGARAVLIGRPYLYALAAAGERGVARVIEILEAEMRRTMTLMGCQSVQDLGPSWIGEPDPGLTPPGDLPAHT